MANLKDVALDKIEETYKKCSKGDIIRDLFNWFNGSELNEFANFIEGEH